MARTSKQSDWRGISSKLVRMHSKNPKKHAQLTVLPTVHLAKKKPRANRRQSNSNPRPQRQVLPKSMPDFPKRKIPEQASTQVGATGKSNRKGGKPLTFPPFASTIDPAQSHSNIKAHKRSMSELSTAVGVES